MPFLGKISGGLLGARAAQAVASRNAALYGVDAYRPVTSTAEDLDPSRMCGAPLCTTGWVKPWKNRRRPIFEGEWGCSGRCLHSLVQAAVRREVGEHGSYAEDGAHRHRVPLGLVLLAQGWITHPQLQAALQAQKSSGEGRIGDWLVQSCGLPEEHITRGLGVQWSCPVLSLDGFTPAAMARVMPKKFVAEFGMVPLRLAGQSLLYLAFENSMNAAAALAVEQMNGIKVESGLLNEAQFAHVKRSVLEEDAVPATVTSVAHAEALSAEVVKVLDQRQPVASRLVRVHGYYWMRIWLETGAMAGPGKLPPSNEDVEDYIFQIGR